MEPGAFQCQVQGQWTQTEMQNVPFEHQETIFLSALAQIGQGGCGMPTFGGTKNVQTWSRTIVLGDLARVQG